ncbi:hypothetical protein [Rhodoplanes sp. SY1]|uniref:hypothetical protein n=1 Tax=Rhodoplanes sp. SY1 TaxID=3166646 RepID=UPI0038B61884
MGSPNTFGTFLTTLQTLESARPSGSEAVPHAGSGRPSTVPTLDADILAVARMVVPAPDGAPVGAIRDRVTLAPDAFFGAVLAGRDKGVFELDDTGTEPVLKLTRLGRSLAG